MERSKEIFGNVIDDKTYKKALKSKKKYQRKYGDESKTQYHLSSKPLNILGKDKTINKLELAIDPMKFDKKAIIIGNIRMGFGHYRICLAFASCAIALGYKPYWFDLNSFKTTGGKMVEHQNKLYSMGSKLSQKSKLFNKVFWEPMNSEGFRQLTYNAIDQKNSELLVPLYTDFPKDAPFIATHVWPSQGAVHAGMTNVCNAIPDNWPMALHLSEGALHTVQTHFAYLGYKRLNGFAKKKVLLPMPDDSLKDVGHYIDHELVANLENDIADRLDRINNNKPLRLLLTVGGAGAQYPIFKAIVKHLLPYINENKVVLFINFGDHEKVLKKMCKDIEELENTMKIYDNKYDEFIKDVSNNSFNKGIIAMYNKEIFEAVYSTNVLMRVCDLLITKPSELAYYPIPKLMIQRVGGHEAYGAIHASEYGDGTYECRTSKEINKMLDSLLNDKSLLTHMNENIIHNKESGLYDGAYNVIKLITKSIRK